MTACPMCFPQEYSPKKGFFTALVSGLWSGLLRVIARGNPGFSPAVPGIICEERIPGLATRSNGGEILFNIVAGGSYPVRKLF